MKTPEKRWLGVGAALVVLVTSAPYVAGWLTAPKDQPFSGVLLAQQDVFSYLAKMRLGAEGEWLYHNPYVVGPQPKAPLYGVYLTLGHLTAPGGDSRVPMSSLALAYAIARVVFGAALLVVLYRVIGLFTAVPSQRRLAWVLIALGGGLGWLMLLTTGEALPFGSPPLDTYLAEATTLVPLLTYPHVLLARAALLGGVLCLVRADEGAGRRWVAAAAACWLVATIGVPFDVLVAGGIVGGWIAARWLMSHQFPKRLAGMGLLAGLPAAAIDVLALVMIGTDPGYASWVAQNRLPLPHIVHFASAFGVQAAFAIPGLIDVWGEKPARSDLLIGWLIAGPLLILIPVPFQLRLIEGFAIPLGILSIAGLARISRLRFWSAAAIALFALVMPTSLFLLIGGTASALGGFGRFKPDQAAMLEWLRAHADPGSVVLSSAETGVMLPAAAPVTAMLGHGFETPDFDHTQAYVTAFYRGGLTPNEVLALMAANRVRYVIFGPDEAQLLEPGQAGHELLTLEDSDLPLVLDFKQGEYRIYEVGSP